MNTRSETRKRLLDDSSDLPIVGDMSALFTIRELAARWKVSQSTIRREIVRGRLASLMIGGQLRFTRDEVGRYEKEA